MACAAPICTAISTSSCSAGTAAATPQRPSTPCSASARASDPPTTATSSDNAADPGRPGASHRPPSDPPQSGPSTGPPACLTALETNFPKSKSSRTSPGTVQEPCLERRRPINIWCDRKQREKPFNNFRSPNLQVTHRTSEMVNPRRKIGPGNRAGTWNSDGPRGRWTLGRMATGGWRRGARKTTWPHGEIMLDMESVRLHFVEMMIDH